MSCEGGDIYANIKGKQRENGQNVLEKRGLAMKKDMSKKLIVAIRIACIGSVAMGIGGMPIRNL